MARPRQVATTLVGTGRLARALAPILADAGHPVAAIVGRTAAAARAVARLAPGARATTDPGLGAACGRLVLLAVPDRALASTAAGLAACAAVRWKERVVLHHAGAFGCEPLRPLRRAGAGVGLLHPLVALGVARLAPRLLPGCRARVEGDRRGLAAARRLTRALGMTPLPLPPLAPAERVAYHAAASLVSNDLLALVSMGCELLASLGLGERRALAALLPLARGTLLQIESAGLGGPLTGPAARGDVATLEAHLRRLARGRAADAEIHRLLSLRLARLARARGLAGAAATRAVLAGPAHRRGL
jgi:predicted short-subunit dehydrogenase-like oxidoreductase (DUF2520 family)